MDDRSTRARNLHTLTLHPAIQLAAALVFEVEGIEGAEERVGMR